MDINDAACARGQARLNKSVVLREVILVDITRHGIVRQELPANGETEDVKTIVLNEVQHLAETVCTIVLSERRPGSARGTVTVCIAAEVEACNVYTGEPELASVRRGGACR